MQVDKEFLRQCIIDATSDDYESISTFGPEISTWARQEGKQYSHEGLVDALRELTNEGAVAAFRYVESQNKFVVTTFDKESLSELWFLRQKSPVSN